MPADAGLVALDRPLPHSPRSDVGEPVLEPRGDGGGRRLGHGARVALALQLPDLVHDETALHRADVAAVEAAVELVADGDPAVPATVGALVDRRLAVRRTSRHPLPLGALSEAQCPGALA